MDVEWPRVEPGEWGAEDLFRDLEGLVRHRQRGVVSRHKPLALVWAVGQLVRGHDRLFGWAEFRGPVGEVLREFGHPGSHVTPQYPFWHLRSAPGLWETRGLAEEPTSADAGALAGFTERAAELLGDVAIRERALRVLREGHLGGVDHEALWRRVGLAPAPSDLDGMTVATYRKEQGELRDLLLGGATGAPCALCGRVLPAELLVAAHIKPRARCGPEERLDLGSVAMLACALGCDRLFELGHLAVDERGAVLASDDLPASHLPFVEGRVARGGERSAGYFAWHREHVFRGRRSSSVGGPG
ncbi:hypothetical protein GCM10009634_11840 [Saccharothrix xinjiangensis]